MTAASSHQSKSSSPRRRRPHASWFGAALLLWAVGVSIAACGSGSKKSKDAAHCTSDRGCSGSRVCRIGKCYDPCEKASECEDGERCLAGACLPAPAPIEPDCHDSDAPFCEGDTLVSCDNEQVIEQPCVFGCLDGACLDCQLDSRSCENGDVRICDDKGEISYEACDKVCDNGQCVDQCQDNTANCDGYTVQVCSGGVFVDMTECAGVCMDGKCMGECHPDAVRCASGPARIEQCNGNATWETSEICPGAAAVCYVGADGPACAPCDECAAPDAGGNCTCPDAGVKPDAGGTDAGGTATPDAGGTTDASSPAGDASTLDAGNAASDASADAG